ncbi:hypothetical protein FJTKL_05897 [Diaporthe vaccinii]|uniref:Uncharacterized protein n=1 Tax=Diaporthe vaccinii TaxID=105482 RepID=A0ABR4EYF3_9PEZI
MRAVSLRGQSDAETTKQRPVVHNESRLPIPGSWSHPSHVKFKFAEQDQRACVFTLAICFPSFPDVVECRLEISFV